MFLDDIIQCPENCANEALALSQQVCAFQAELH